MLCSNVASLFKLSVTVCIGAGMFVRVLQVTITTVLSSEYKVFKLKTSRSISDNDDSDVNVKVGSCSFPPSQGRLLVDMADFPDISARRRLRGDEQLSSRLQLRHQDMHDALNTALYLHSIMNASGFKPHFMQFNGELGSSCTHLDEIEAEKLQLLCSHQEAMR